MCSLCLYLYLYLWLDRSPEMIEDRTFERGESLAVASFSTFVAPRGWMLGRQAIVVPQDMFLTSHTEGQPPRSRLRCYSIVLVSWQLVQKEDDSDAIKF